MDKEVLKTIEELAKLQHQNLKLLELLVDLLNKE